MTEIITQFLFEESYIEVVSSTTEQFESIGNILNHNITIDSSIADVEAVLQSAGHQYTIIGGRPPSR